ncbi:MAG: beta-ketoacyl-[acyl-carrier-protein] synthase family protein [Salinivirgaceae bacterium]|nr:beta-ketoacyl-[acyl-carrier-protein] synthase family protein [Salinivirgaceae bacterium]
MKIAVTGLGVVSGIGLDVDENIDALKHKRHGMEKPHFFTHLDVPVSEVKVPNVTLLEYLGYDFNFFLSRTALFGITAAREALSDSGIDVHKMRVGLISSTSVGGMDLSEEFYYSFRENHEHGRLRWVSQHDCGSSTELIAKCLHITGFRTTVSTACSSAGNAIMLGARMLKHNMLDAVIVGGTDSLCKFTLNGFNSLMILDKEHCRPFDATRAGLNLGEGAGYIVLQNAETARRKPYCLLTGYANANDAYHQTGCSPEGNGAFKSMSEAIAMSGVKPEEIDYINVHGTGTPNNDLSEGMALKRIFGDKVPPFSSVKAFIGHTLGASEGIEAVYSALSVSYGFIYPNLNFKSPAPETQLVPETEFSEGNNIRNVLSNAFGFGGNDTTLLFSKFEE